MCNCDSKISVGAWEPAGIVDGVVTVDEVILFKYFSILPAKFKFNPMLALELILDSSDRLSGHAKGANPNQLSYIKSTLPKYVLIRVSHRESVVGMNLVGG